MFNFVLVGLNHRTTKLDVRQLASFTPDQMSEGLKRLPALPGILESMIISTCNRVEIIASVDPKEDAVSSIESFLSDHSGIDASQLHNSLYCYSGELAVKHVFRVASSLDSMILGEPQILGQLKSCYGSAVEMKSIGTGINSLLQAAFRVAKRVRSETQIGEYPVSVSSAAVELLRKIFGDLQKKNILIVGAGKMGEVAIRHLADAGAKAVYVANRSPEAASNLAAKFDGTAVPFSQLQEWISRVDIVIASTGATEVLIDLPMVKQAMQERKNAPIAFIDISVPRNIDPAISEADNVFCYDIDDLAAVVEANLHERTKAAANAEKIVVQEVAAFCKKMQSFAVGPVVMKLQGQIEEICRSELQRSLRKMGPQDTKNIQELETMISRIAGKIAHPLVVQLRNSPDAENKSNYMDLIEKIVKAGNAK